MPWKLNPFTGQLDYFGVGGPAAGVSTDNAIARWDGAGGDLLQDSLVILDDSGNLIMGGGAAIKVADGNPQIIFDDANNWLEITGKVGIGTATPVGTLHVASGISGATAHDTGDEFVFEGASSVGLSFLSPDTHFTRFYLGSPTANRGAGFTWRYNDRLFTIGSMATGGEVALKSGNNVEAIRIDSNGNFGLGATSFGANMAGGMAIALGTEPTGDVANQFAISAFDFAIGNTCPRLRSENGTLIGLNQGLLTTDNVVHAQFSCTGLTLQSTRVAATPYAVLATDDTIFVDTDGLAIAINLPAGVDGKPYRIINCGSSGNDATLSPNGAELLMGVNASQAISDGESLEIMYETVEGWW